MTQVIENEVLATETNEQEAVVQETKKRNITKHFMIRWAERIVGLASAPKQEINEYITVNREKIASDANKSFEYATYLYTGQIGDNTTKNYYIKDDMIFVTNTDDSAFVTIYKVYLGISEKISTMIRKEIVQLIEELQKEKYEADFAVEQEVEEKTEEIRRMDEEIKILAEQLNIMKERRKFADEQVRDIKKKSINVGLELKKKVLVLVDSKEYKDDLGQI